jgi:3-oxoacyl-[acyl-carrier protein] reductase
VEKGVVTAIPPPPYPPAGKNLLAGKTVLITAAAGTGIGFATARRALEEGAKVMISDVHERRLAEAAKELGVPSARCNVAVEADVQALWAAAEREFGRIDVLVNNAGLGATATVVEMTDEQWQQVMDISLTGTMRMMRAGLRHMTAHGGGAIVNNASVLAWRAQAGQAAYAAAKAGVMALTRCAAVEAAAAGVRVNAVSPSLAMHKHLVKVTSQDVLDTLTARELFGRGAEPWEVANVILFLASDYASYMTGEVVSVSSQHP